MRLSWAAAPLLTLGIVSVVQGDLSKCTKCPIPEETNAPGIGFALEMGYGTAAIKHPDGTVQTIAQIPGSEAYTNLMTHLATTKIELLPDGRRMPDVGSQQHLFFYVVGRWFRKLTWRPATPEIAILIEMVEKLKSETEKVLAAGKGEGKVKSAVLVSPDRARLTVEEVDDVFEYLGVRNVMRDGNEVERSFTKRNGGVFGMGAAWAGLGRGLCGEYLDAEKCVAEEEVMAEKRVLHVDFGKKALGCSIDKMTTAVREHVDESVIDVKLGLDNAKDEKYWDEVASFIKGFVAKWQGGKVDEVILTGESVGEEKFKDAVKSALRDHVESDDVLMALDAEPEKDPLYVVAMGAAEIAKRKQEGMARCVRGKGDCKSIEHDEI